MPACRPPLPALFLNNIKVELFLYFFRAYPQRTLLVFAAASIASVITAVTLLLLPALLLTLLGKSTGKTQFINDFLMQAGIYPGTEMLMALLITGIVLQNALLASANIYAGFTRAKIIKDLRIQLLTTMSQTEWAFFTRQSSGNFTAAIVNEIEGAGDGYQTMVIILSNAVQMVAYLSVALFISWQIAVIAIITSLMLALIFGRLILVSKKLGAQGTMLTRLMTAQLTDSYRSIKSLKAMYRESHAHALLSSYSKQMKSVDRKETIAGGLLDSLQEIILMTAVILTIYFSFKTLNLPIEFSIILVILYLRSMKLFGKSQKQLQVFLGNINAYHMVIQTMANVKQNREKRDGTIQHDLCGDIVFDNVCFQHDQTVVLEHANATFHNKKLTSIIGPSGEGKTTTADLICGLFEPGAGRIIIGNIPLEKIDIKHWRKQIGYVTQENNLLNTTIKENVTLGNPEFTDEAVNTALKKSHCARFIAKLPDGIHTGVGENGAHLSGGQRQRILIARAIVHSPRLLILDEATSALDSETEKRLSDIFKELSREIMIISISHRPAVVQASDYILKLSNSAFSQ